MRLLQSLLFCLLAGAAYASHVPVGGLLPHHVPRAWIKLDNPPTENQMIDFHIQLPLCNIERMEKLLLEEVSNPKHPNYAQYLTSEQVEHMSSCGTEPMEKVVEWLKAEGVPESHIHARLTHVRVETHARKAESLFKTSVRAYKHKKSNKEVTRAFGMVHVPSAVKKYIHFVSGLTELHDVSFRPSMVTPPVFSRRSNPLVTPAVLRRLYNLREDLGGGLASDNSQGIAAFEDWFYEDDLCAAHQLLAPVEKSGENLFNAPKVSYNGPTTGEDNGESDLDTQYITMMAPKVETVFYNHPSGTWILGWAQQAVNLTTSKGPWVWSISYGWPEMAECDSAMNVTLCASLGLDWETYIQRTNAELMKLGLMGVSVLVSSGDDGSPGFSITCPVDAAQSTNFTGIPHIPCPLDDPTKCKCGSISITRNMNGETMNCFFPQALLWEGQPLVDGVLGADCDFSDKTSLYLLYDALQTLSDQTQCQNFFNDTFKTFASTCECQDIPSVTSSYNSSSLTISGFQFSKQFSRSPFASDFPAASPFVLSVGATMIMPDMNDECGAPAEEMITTAKMRSFDAGGGFSILSSRPAWQEDQVQKYLAQPGLAPSLSYFNSSNRAYPDISLNGHNYVVVINRTADKIGGTSASAPAFSAMISLMNDVLLSNGKKPLGFLPPLMYQMYAEAPQAFNNIVSHTFTLPDWWLSETGGRVSTVVADDNACTRTFCCQFSYKSNPSGWDPVTGLGTPNMFEIENYIRKMNGLPLISDIPNEPASPSALSAPPALSYTLAFYMGSTAILTFLATALVMKFIL